MKRVVITGLGALTPLGNSVDEFWQNLIAGKSGAGPITKFDTTKFKANFACEVKNFRAEDYIEKKEIKKYDTFTQYAIAASDQAIRDSGLDFVQMDETQRAEVGVIWASGNGGISTFEEQLMEYYKGDCTPRFSPYFIPKMIVDIAAGVISIRHKLYGPNYCTVSACASSNTAIINAFDTIRLGKANIMIAGGSEAAITPGSVGGFISAQALSKNNDMPQKASRPFDKDRDGFVMGEGAAALVLEEWEHAVKRGAHIYAELTGGGMAADAYHLTGTPPDGRGAALGMQKALADAGITADKIDYINAHATSTLAGDASEARAIDTVFGQSKTPVSSTKSMTGHECWMAGASEIVYSSLMMQESFMAPNINFETPDNDSSKLNIVEKTMEKNIDVFLSNSFGFGGTNSTLIVKKWKK